MRLVCNPQDLLRGFRVRSLINPARPRNLRLAEPGSEWPNGCFTEFQEKSLMPMIDIYAAAGTLTDTHKLATDAAALIKAVEGVPEIAMFRKNTAAFIHEMPRGT